jgi:hypothetical protein
MIKRTVAWFITAPCLLAATGLLAACDARQWPLADYRSGQPKATTWRQPVPATGQKAGANHPTQTERNTAAAKPPAATSSVVTATSGTVTASTVMPGPASESGDVSLIGLDMAQARRRLGPPTEEIEQAPAKVWRYRTAQCSLDVSLYPDVHTQIFRVLNYEVKGNDGTEQGRRKCISDLRAGSLSR